MSNKRKNLSSDIDDFPGASDIFLPKVQVRYGAYVHEGENIEEDDQKEDDQKEDVNEIQIDDA